MTRFFLVRASRITFDTLSFSKCQIKGRKNELLEIVLLVSNPGNKFEEPSDGKP